MNCMDVFLCTLYGVNIVFDVLNSYAAYKTGNMSAFRGWGCAALGFAAALVITLKQ